MTSTKYEKRKLRIWLIHHGEPPPVLCKDTPFRYARLAKELASRGHDVTYWCSSMWHHRKELICQENQVLKVDGYHLHIIHAGKYQSNYSFSRYLHHRKMAKLFSIEARKVEIPNIIIAGLPIHYCACEAVRFGKENKFPVIVDIRDYWPDNLLRIFPKRLQWLGRFVFKRDFAITKELLQNATSLVSVMSHLLEWGRKQCAERRQDSDDTVFFIGGDDLGSNSCKDLSQLFPEIERRIHGRFVVSYVGSFTSLTHPMVIIKAARFLDDIGKNDRFLFILAGNGDYYKRCVNEAKGLDNVVFPGWIDAEGIAVLNSVSSVGVIPSYEDVSFPNKAFSYLGSGLPILFSGHGDLLNLLKKNKAGFYFDISDPKQLANKLLDLSKLDSESYAEISRNAKYLFQNYLRADKIYQRYADHIEYIVKKYAIEKGK